MTVVQIYNISLSVGSHVSQILDISERYNRNVSLQDIL